MHRSIIAAPKTALAFAAAMMAACSDTPLQPSAGAGLSTISSLASVRKGPEFIPGQYIVVLRDDVADARGKAREKAAKHSAKLTHTFSHALKGFAAGLTPAAVQQLRNDPDVAYIEEDQIVRVSTVQTGATWGLDRVDQRTLPLSGTYEYVPTGNGVTVYIVDTGIRFDHAEFGGRAAAGFDAIGDGQNAADCNGHGTHVAGTVGGAKYGVARNVRLVSVRVLSCTGSGTLSGVIAGVDWVTANAAKPATANMSLGGGASTALDDAVRRAIASGISFAVAAGNDAVDACYGSPSRVAEAITVGATTSSDARASFSNYGSCLDVFAPGAGITSAWYTSATSTATINGTSMAAPHVAGVAALYLEGNPAASASAVASAINGTATVGALTGIGNGSPNRLVFSPLNTTGANVGSGTTAPCTSCTPYPGTLSGAGDYDFQPNGNYYHAGGYGTHRGWLRADAGTDFDLYLYKWNGWNWSLVARATTSSSSESISYSGSAGYYLWEVRSYSGSGAYTFYLQKP